MKKSIIKTSDGSDSIAIPELNLTYHSIHGAIRESMDVFIGAGLKYFMSRKANAGERKPATIEIFEMGFGTGLNSLLTLMEADYKQQPVHYTTIDLFPVDIDTAHSLNFCEQLNEPFYRLLFENIHNYEWGTDIFVSPYFAITKVHDDLTTYISKKRFDLIYYDAFAPAAQPELWTKEIFQKLFQMMKEDGILVTYCSKADVRRSMQSVGFTVEKIPGPPHKREMLRAIKPLPTS